LNKVGTHQIILKESLGFGGDKIRGMEGKYLMMKDLGKGMPYGFIFRNMYVF
jgi:hypothetical protein